MKKIFLSALLLLGTVSALATAPANTVMTSDNAFQIDRWMGPVALANSLGSRLYRAHTVAYGTLDCKAQSCAAGDLTLGMLLPAKSIVLQVFFDVITAVTPSGTSIAFKLLTSADVKGVTAAGSWTSQVAGIQDGTVTHMLKVGTSATNLKATISGSTATAGKIRVFADYIVSE